MEGVSEDGPRPRSWEELRRRVLHEGYLMTAELHERRRKAHLLKLALWLLPIAVGTAVPLFVTGPRWVGVTIVVLGGYAAVTSHRIGVRWEQRWDELIRARGGERRPPSGQSFPRA